MIETVLYICICLLFSAFFSSIEISFVSADPLQLTLRQNQQDFVGKLLRKFYERRDNFLTTTLIGNTISLVVYGVFFAKLLDPPLRELIGEGNEITLLLLQTFVSTGVVLAFAEFTPKYLGLIFSRNLRLLSVLVQIMNPIYYLLRPFTWLVLKTNRLLVNRLLGMEKKEERRAVKLEDLSNFLHQAEARGADEKPLEINMKMFDNAIAFQDSKVRDCMIPRTEIVAIEISRPIEELQELFLESGHSKVIVYKETIDQVEGYCHAIRMYERPKKILDIRTEIHITPETTPIITLMRALIAESKTIALVTDEFGGTAGIVTMEDIVEEIFGEIEDEHDKPEEDTIKKIGEHTYQLNARSRIKELREDEGWNIPEGDYDTLGGFIIQANGQVPEAGDVIDEEGFVIQILEVDGARIGNVQVKVPDPESDVE